MSEILALIRDLDLVPRNYWASDVYQLLENESERLIRMECDMSLLSKRNHSRKTNDVHKTYCSGIQGTLEF